MTLTLTLLTFLSGWLQPVVAFSLLPLLKGIVMTLFVMTCLLLVLVILVQEGKGGGIAGAFGGAAAESFGVKAGSVNRFTAVLAAIFMGLALLHAGLASAIGGSVVEATPPSIVPAGSPPSTPAVVPPMMSMPSATVTLQHISAVREIVSRFIHNYIINLESIPPK